MSERVLWEFRYHDGAKVTHHLAPREWIDAARAWAEEHGLDVVITEVAAGSVATRTYVH